MITRFWGNLRPKTSDEGTRAAKPAREQHGDENEWHTVTGKKSKKKRPTQAQDGSKEGSRSQRRSRQAPQPAVEARDTQPAPALEPPCQADADVHSATEQSSPRQEKDLHVPAALAWLSAGSKHMGSPGKVSVGSTRVEPSPTKDTHTRVSTGPGLAGDLTTVAQGSSGLPSADHLELTRASADHAGDTQRPDDDSQTRDNAPTCPSGQH